MARDLFSALYMQEPLDKEGDSRMRRRLATESQALAPHTRNVAGLFKALVEGELGVAMPNDRPSP